MEVKAKDTLVDTVEEQRQLGLDAKRQIHRPFVSSATGAPLSYVVDRTRMLEAATVGCDLITAQGPVAHTAEQGKAVLADFTAARKKIEDDAHAEKLVLQTDIVNARAALAKIETEPQMELPLANV